MDKECPMEIVLTKAHSQHLQEKLPTKTFSSLSTFSFNAPPATHAVPIRSKNVKFWSRKLMEYALEDSTNIRKFNYKMETVEPSCPQEEYPTEITYRMPRRRERGSLLNVVTRL
jgi:hypothetical protein